MPVATNKTALPVPEITPEKPQKITPEIKRNKNKGNFDKSGLKSYVSTYRYKVQHATPKSIEGRTARHEYLKYKLETFDKNQVNGLVFVDLDNADTWYKMSFLKIRGYE